jgi:hypothetical protein
MPATRTSDSNPLITWSIFDCPRPVRVGSTPGLLGTDTPFGVLTNLCSILPAADSPRPIVPSAKSSPGRAERRIPGHGGIAPGESPTLAGDGWSRRPSGPIRVLSRPAPGHILRNTRKGAAGGTYERGLQHDRHDPGACQGRSAGLAGGGEAAAADGLGRRVGGAGTDQGRWLRCTGTGTAGGPAGPCPSGVA